MNMCPECGSENLAGKAFCGKCGARQVDQPESQKRSASANEDRKNETSAKLSGSGKKSRSRFMLIAIPALILCAAAIGLSLFFLIPGDESSSKTSSKGSPTISITSSPEPEAVEPEEVSAVSGVLPSDCPVEGLSDGYQIIKNDRTETTLTCVVGIPNSGMGVWFDYEVVSAEQWASKRDEYVSQGAMAVSLGFGEQEAFSLETQGMDGPEMSYLIYKSGVVLSMTAQTMNAVQLAASAIL